MQSNVPIYLLFLDFEYSRKAFSYTEDKEEFTYVFFHYLQGLWGFFYIYVPVTFILVYSMFRLVQEFIPVYSMRYVSSFIFFSKLLPSCLSSIYFKVHLSYNNLKYHIYLVLNFHMCCVYFWIFFSRSTPLVCLTIYEPVSHCFNYSNFVVCFNVQQSQSFLQFYLFSVFMAILEFFI